MMHKPQTLQQYLFEKLEGHPERLDLVIMMSSLATIAKLLASQISRAGLTDLRGLTTSENVHAETQAKLDVYANDLCKSYLAGTGLFAALASEEEEQVVDLKSPDAKYVIAFDPLDGSSNIDVNIAVGTIFSVHRKLDGVEADSDQHFLQPGSTQAVAGYVLYSSSTMLVFSWGDGVHAFTLDVDLGEFLLSDENVKIPADCPYYSLNEAYTSFMMQRDQAYVQLLRGRISKQRWIASLVADFHRNLIVGGVFFLPAFDTSGQGNFKPKLRLNYEVKPMAFLAEQAGGAALAGDQRVLDIVPSTLHERTAAIFGNKDMVNLYKETA